MVQAAPCQQRLEQTGQVASASVSVSWAPATNGAISLVDCDEQAIEARRFFDRPEPGKRRPQQVKVSLGKQPDSDDTFAGVIRSVHEVTNVTH